MVRVKICGIRTWEEAKMAVDAGAHALGFVFASSPRRINPEAAREIILRLPPFVARVGVFVNQPRYEVQEIASFCNLQALQFHGDEDPAYCQRWPGYQVIKALRVGADFAPGAAGSYPVDAVLLDAYVAGKYGGTGESFNWDAAVAVRERVDCLILAGGLNPDNVRLAAEKVRPYAVDVSSGVEEGGAKCRAKVERFMQQVLGAC
ncbi:MAG: phosphoribosylanthranilate isomerase [Clostridia bacterium]|nr:MAG: phosphoribosylanthranilate isomerase [Clostridia bacterium]